MEETRGRLCVLSDADGSVSRTIATLFKERGGTIVSQMAEQGGSQLLLYLASPRETVPWAKLNGVFVNKYRGHSLLTRKSRLARLLRGYTWHPPTFVLSPPEVCRPQVERGKKVTPLQAQILADKQRALAEEDQQERQALRLAAATRSSCWIVKDAQGAKGSNIYVSRSAAEAEAEVDSGRHTTSTVVQAYLADPYLLPGERKFDIRIWVLIDPIFRVFAHRQGVCRTSSVPYDKHDLSNTLSHITNHCIQETSESFGQHEPGNELFFEGLSKLLADAAISFEDDIWPQITSILCCVGAQACDAMRNDPSAVADKTAPRCFQLFGFDFLLDAQATIHLLEVNGSPACAETLRETIVRDLVAVLLDATDTSSSQVGGFTQVWSPSSRMAADGQR